MAPGGSFTFTETRAIQAGDPTPLTNTATVIFTLAQNLGSFSNLITANASASVTLLPQLTITKAVTGGVDTIHPGDTASFTITVTNDGAGPATNVVVTDQLPEADSAELERRLQHLRHRLDQHRRLPDGHRRRRLAAGATRHDHRQRRDPRWTSSGRRPAPATATRSPPACSSSTATRSNDPAVAGDDWSNVARSATAARPRSRTAS